MRISIIAAMAHNRVIGSDNRLPWGHLPADMDWFKENTMRKPVLMGRKTFDSLGKPLSGLDNFVVSETQGTIDGATVFPSLEAALAALKDCSEVMVIGGGSIYEQCLPHADRLYLTFIDADLSRDTRFPLWGHKHFQETFVGHQVANEDNEFDMKFVILDKEKAHANVVEAY